ncbi:MAG: hypothetical protein R3E64_04105 [Halioglobus sp.]
MKRWQRRIWQGAPRSPVESKGCIKLRYPGESEARNALRKLHWQARSNPGKRRKHKECRAYHCDLCNGWHLTSSPVPHGY